MATGEEYLDNLLKSLIESEEAAKKKEEETASEDAVEIPEIMAEEEPTAEDAVEIPEIRSDEEPVIEEAAINPDDEVYEEPAVEMPGKTLDEEEWKADLDDLLAQVGGNLPEEEQQASDLEGMNDLFQADNKDETSTDDMLALLESMEVGSDDASDMNDLLGMLANDIDIPVVSENDNNEHEEVKFKKKRAGKKSKDKKKGSLFGRKKRPEDIAEENVPEEFIPDVDIINDAMNDTMNDVMDDVMNDVINDDPELAQIPEKVSKEKKPGFFSKLINLLTEEEEEPESESVQDLATDEASGEAGEASAGEETLSKKEEKKKKKEEKKKKKGKKGKGSDTEGENPDASEGESEQEDPKKKAKREKKERKKQEKLLQKQEKPVKVLSRRKLLVLIAACATLIAGLLSLSIFLPDYADKKMAREAYYIGDYQNVYELLYDKRMNDSDQLIFNRAQTVLRLEKKLSSYRNNIAMNREAEAIDALLRGVLCYADMPEADEYGVRKEIDAVYQEICSILESAYGINEEEAKEINSYDDETYTRRLYSIVNGTEFVKPGEEEAMEKPLPPQDVLEEEETIISYEQGQE